MSASTSGLSSVVSKLTRASFGASVSSDVKDSDLDRYVADLIMKEAKSSEERYKGKEGIRAYLPVTVPEASKPKTNKRFLHSLIRNVDDHNMAIIREQAKAGEEVRAQREEEERAERRARAVEASEERMRRLMGGTRRRSRERHDSPSAGSSGSRSKDYAVSSSRRQVDWRQDDNDGSRDRDYDYGRSSRASGSASRRREDEDDIEARSRDRSHKSSRRASPRRTSSPSPHTRPSNPRSKTPRASPTPFDNKRASYPFIPADEQTTLSESSAPSASASRHSDRKHRHRSPTPEPDRSTHHKSKRRRSRSRSLEARDRDRARSRSASPKPRSSKSHRDHDRHHSSSHRDRHPSRERSSRADADPEREHRSHHRDREGDKGKKHKDKARHTLDDDEVPVPSRPGHSSKMDKYFDPAYDPALDYTPVMDQNTLVEDGAFDNWNTMLQLVRLRREDKEEKKRREKEGDKASERVGAGSSGEPGIMDIVYKKRGATREWDLGKD